MTDRHVDLVKGFEDPSSSLLARVGEKDPDAWRRLVRLYTPLIYHWCRKSGLSEDDAADVGQEVFGSVARAIVKYTRHEGKTFCGWLRTITVNKIRDLHRRRPPVEPAYGGEEALSRFLAVQDPHGQDSSIEPSQNEEMILMRQAVEMILSEFADDTRKAFLKVVVDRRRPADVADELGISVNAVYLAKSRVRQRLKKEFAGLIDSL